MIVPDFFLWRAIRDQYLFRRVAIKVTPSKKKKKSCTNKFVNYLYIIRLNSFTFTYK